MTASTGSLIASWPVMLITRKPNLVSNVPWNATACIRELFADRGAVTACGDVRTAISLLLKVQTGLAEPDVDAYRAQVADVFADGPLASDGGTHPEGFIRVRAMDGWCSGADGVEEQIADMIAGPLHLDRLDCLDQQVVEQLTKKLYLLHLQLPWMRSEACVGQVRLIWSDLPEPIPQLGEAAQGDLIRDLGHASDHLNDYWCYLLLDLAMADRDLEDLGILAGQLTAQRLGLHEQFDTVANKEVKVTKRRLGEIWSERERLQAAARQEAQS